MNIDSRRRTEQVHYLPPNRRRTSNSTPIIPPPPPPASGPITNSYINSPSLSSRVLHDSPSLSHRSVPTQRFEPPPHAPIQPIRPRTDFIDHQMSPAMHRRDSDRIQVREAPRLRSGSDVHYASIESPGAKYSPRPAHVIRERSYDSRDRGYDERPSYRSQRPSVGHESLGLRSSPAVPQIRILRNPERERERVVLRREMTDEHMGGRGFIRPDLERSRTYQPDADGARYMGEKIHNLTPTTSLKERVGKFVTGLSGEPPEIDEPYEYPDTIPCDPKTLPPPPQEKRRPGGYMDEGSSGGFFRSHTMPSMRERDTRRAPPRPSRRHYDDYDSEEDECVRGMYRMHT